MSATTTQSAMDLMPQLRDILQLPEDLDLPPLYSVTMEAKSSGAGWSVRAQLRGDGADGDRWAALRAWGTGQEPDLDAPFPSRSQPSGAFRTASVTVVVGSVSVEVWSHVDGGFVPPGWCCVDSYRAQGPCAECAVVGTPKPLPEFEAVSAR